MPLLAACGLAETSLSDTRHTVSPETYHALVREALDATGDPGLGLAIGLRAPEAMLHVVGHLMFASATLRDALTCFRRYSALLAEGERWDLTEREHTATFSYMPAFQLGDSTRFTNEFVLAMAWRIGRHFALCPERRPPDVRFQHAAPAYAASYETAFGGPIRFGQPANAIVFHTATLDARQLHADDALCATLSEAADQLLRERAQITLAERVRAMLRARRDLSDVNTTALALAVSLTPRALRSRLRAEGASLANLINEARLRVAREDLRRPDCSIKDLACRLGFSEPSAFHRAFKRWTGTTPSAYAHSPDVTHLLHGGGES
jgi:AraC-like DNA-binding protein